MATYTWSNNTYNNTPGNGIYFSYDNAYTVGGSSNSYCGDNYTTNNAKRYIVCYNVEENGTVTFEKKYMKKEKPKEKLTRFQIMDFD